jgi:hypothetical protein
MGKHFPKHRLIDYSLNRACFAKFVARGFQEVLNEISFSRFLEQVDSKIWRVHLLIFDVG